MMRHPPRSTFFPYTALSRSASVVLRLYRLILQPVFHWLTLSFTLGARRAAETLSAPKQNRLRRWIGRLLAAGVVVGLGFAVYHAARELSGLHRDDYGELLESAALTFLRVNTVLILGALWTVPAGVAIACNPRLSRIARSEERRVGEECRS